MPNPLIGAVCGLKSEAALLAPLVEQGRLLVRASGADSARAAKAAEELVAEGVTALLSFGLCGALSAEVSAGDLVLPEAVLAEDETWPCDAGWRARLREGLPPGLLRAAQGGTILGSDRAIATAEEKAALALRSSALAVDMESHALARTARRHGLPFLVVRACSDEAGQALPEAALRATRPDGGIDLAAVLAGLARRPQQLPVLIALGKGSRRAHQTLRRVVESGALLRD